MARHVNLSFEEHPAEAHLIGIMLAGYGELEFELSSLVTVALGGNPVETTQGIKVLYRLRSEGQRLDVADAVIRPVCERNDLLKQYNATHEGMKWCKKVRNQYAHSHYFHQDDMLFFFNLEDSAKKLEGSADIKMQPIDVPLLKKQVEFFHYTTRWLLYLIAELQVRTGKQSSHARQEQKRLQPPPLHNP